MPAAIDGHELAGILGLFLFMGIFTMVVIYTFQRRNQAKFDRASRLPLEGDEGPASIGDEDRPGRQESRNV